MLSTTQIRRDFAKASAEHIDDRLGAVPRAVASGQHERDRTVGDLADVEQVIGLDDPGRILVIFDRDRPAIHLRLWVQTRPRTLLYGNRAKLFAGRAVHRHVPGRHPAVVTRRTQIAEDLAPVALLLGVRHAAVSLLLRLLRLRPVVNRADENDVVRKSPLQEGRGRGNADTRECTSATDDEVEVRGDSEHAGERVGVAAAVAATARPSEVDRAVDVRNLQARVGDGQPRGLRRHHPLAAIGLRANDDTQAGDGEIGLRFAHSNSFVCTAAAPGPNAIDVGRRQWQVRWTEFVGRHETGKIGREDTRRSRHVRCISGGAGKRLTCL
jgi:hypothetical protein